MNMPASSSAPPPVPRLTERWLLAARLVWVLLVALGLLVLSAALPLRFAQYGDPPAALRAVLESLGISLSAYIAYMTAMVALASLAFLCVGGLIFWRKSDDPIGLVTSLYLILAAAASDPNIDGLIASNAAWLVPARLASAGYVVAFTVLLFTFPNGRVVPRWSRLPLTLWLIASVVIVLTINAYLPVVAGPLVDELLLVAALAGVPAQIYRYSRVSGPSDRQRTKWVTVGLTLAPLGFAVAVLLHRLFPAFAQAGLQATLYDPIGVSVLTLSFTLIPITLGVAILRYHLWDIDLLINRALVYGTLTGALLLVYVTGVVVLQGLFRALARQDSDLAIVAATLAVAVLFLPLRGWIQAFIDRRFFRRKYDAARVLSTFSASLRDDATVERVSDDLLEAVRESVQPVHAGLWLRPTEKRR